MQAGCLVARRRLWRLLQVSRSSAEVLSVRTLWVRPSESRCCHCHKHSDKVKAQRCLLVCALAHRRTHDLHAVCVKATINLHSLPSSEQRLGWSRGNLEHEFRRQGIPLPQEECAVREGVTCPACPNLNTFQLSKRPELQSRADQERGQSACREKAPLPRPLVVPSSENQCEPSAESLILPLLPRRASSHFGSPPLPETLVHATA